MGTAVRSTPEFRDLLTISRQAKGWSQERLALEIGAKQVQVSRWERGETTPSDKQVSTLAVALGIDPVSLFFSLGRVEPSIRRDRDALQALRTVHEENQSWIRMRGANDKDPVARVDEIR